MKRKLGSLTKKPKKTSKKSTAKSKKTTNTSTSQAKNISMSLQVIEVPIEQIVPDPTNPNAMTDEQMKALKKSMKKQNVQPLVIDQDNNLIDGHHRLQALKELGFKTAPCVIKKVKDAIERKMWRQVFNKLRGEHDKTKDKLDIMAIFQNNQLDELTELLGAPKDTFLSMIGQLKDNSEVASDSDPTGGYMESYLHGNVKQITIIMTNEEYVKIFPRMEFIKPIIKATNNTDLLFRLVEYYENHSGNKAPDQP